MGSTESLMEEHESKTSDGRKNGRAPGGTERRTERQAHGQTILRERKRDRPMWIDVDCRVVKNGSEMDESINERGS